MNKPELVSAIATKGELSKKDSEAFLKAFEEVVMEEMKVGGKINLINFCSFEVVDTKARTGRNPSTNQPMDIPAGKKVKVKMGKAMKDLFKS